MISPLPLQVVSLLDDVSTNGSPRYPAASRYAVLPAYTEHAWQEHLGVAAKKERRGPNQQHLAKQERASRQTMHTFRRIALQFAPDHL